MKSHHHNFAAVPATAAVEAVAHASVCATGTDSFNTHQGDYNTNYNTSYMRYYNLFVCLVINFCLMEYRWDI